MKIVLKKSLLFLLLLSFALNITGCTNKDSKSGNGKDIEYTVVEEADLPQQLLSAINDRKMLPFKLTYITEGKDYCYIAVGYGGQKSGGYSITVNGLYDTDDCIKIKTQLMGPKENEPVTSNITYPYIVVKIEYIDKKVEFED